MTLKMPRRGITIDKKNTGFVTLDVDYIFYT